MITAYGDIDLAVRSLKEGAADFVVKPWHNEKLIDNHQGNIEKERKQEQLTAVHQQVTLLSAKNCSENRKSCKIFFTRLKRSHLLMQIF